MKSRALGAVVLLAALTGRTAVAVEPAGGPASQPVSIDDFKTRAGAADDAEAAANARERAWLAKSSRPAIAPADASHGSLFLNLFALIIVAGLAGGAIYLKRRRPASPAKQVAQSIKVLSQVRVGPKAQLVTAEVAGRVLLLGVTESQVSCLSRFDAADIPSFDVTEEKPAPELGNRVESTTRPSSSKVAQIATQRFREVMNGVLRAQRASADETQPLRATNVAQLLALETKDVVQAGTGAAQSASAYAVTAQATVARAAATQAVVAQAVDESSAATIKTATRRIRRKSLDSLPLETQVAGLVARQER